MVSRTNALSISEWLKTAGEPCLAFLRNLSPQILIASLAWVLASKLDFTKFDILNSPQTILFCGFLLLFLYAAFANATIFLASLFPTFEPWLSDHEEKLKSSGKSKFKVPFLMIKAIFSERKTEFSFSGIPANATSTSRLPTAGAPTSPVRILKVVGFHSICTTALQKRCQSRRSRSHLTKQNRWGP